MIVGGDGERLGAQQLRVQEGGVAVVLAAVRGVRRPSFAQLREVGGDPAGGVVVAAVSAQSLVQNQIPGSFVF